MELASIGARLPVLGASVPLILVVPPKAAPFHAWPAHLSAGQWARAQERVDQLQRRACKLGLSGAIGIEVIRESHGPQ
jgi:hypothetical protein